jgi:type II secretory pathway component PulF
VREAIAQVHGGGTLPGRAGAAVTAAVANGRPLSEALALFPDDFPAEDVALLEAGEATGNLDRSLDRLAQRHEARRAARRRFRSASAYPRLLFHLAALLTPLPGALARDGRLFGPSWLASAALVLAPYYAILLAAALLRRKAAGRALLRKAAFAVPGFGQAARRRRVADLADVLGTAYEAGMRLDRALAIAGRAAEDPRVTAAADEVAKGGTLAASLGASRAMPPPLLARIATGEHAGEISRVLSDIAREEADAADDIGLRSIQVTGYLIYFAMVAWIAWYAISTVSQVYTFP